MLITWSGLRQKKTNDTGGHAMLSRPNRLKGKITEWGIRVGECDMDIRVECPRCFREFIPLERVYIHANKPIDAYVECPECCEEFDIGGIIKVTVSYDE
jgi:hypothetical protein